MRKEVSIRDKIIEIVHRHKIDKFGFVPLEKMVFDKSFHDACAANRCGKYGTNWSCPPGAGSFESLRRRVHGFKKALVVQTVWQLEDSFDIEGMLNSGRKHNALFRQLSSDLRTVLQKPPLVLSAGACDLCETCSYILRRPCPRPDQAMGSLEAHGIDVTALVRSCGLNYNNGPNTVSYVGVVMFND